VRETSPPARPAANPNPSSVTSEPSSQSSALDTLNELLRGEMAAIETYRQALEVAEEGEPAETLRALRLHHRDAADVLWHHVEAHGGQPSDGSGAWGAFAKAVEGTARLLGNRAALKALQQGEEHGLQKYEEALRNGLPLDCEMLIRETLLPRQRQHLPVLGDLLERN
jgi:rubrerythrin